MKITVLGAGAMGMLIGGMLSKANDVTLVDINAQAVQQISQHGVVIHQKDDTTQVVTPKATTNTSNMDEQDLVIIFVKAMFSNSALENNKNLIGANTYVMTLQNGAGHEDTLLQFVDEAHIVIGATQHNSSIVALGEINHGGSGHTYIGGLTNNIQQLDTIAQAFNASGLEASTTDKVQELIWNKMFTNVSASVLTGILQSPLGFISKNQHAWKLCTLLVKEAVEVAKGEGMAFDFDEKLQQVKTVCDNAPNGYTSIYADLRDKRRTEVDTISGAVAKAGARNGTPAPTHEIIIALVHAMEEKNENS